jgi:maltose alpha-D-glucosyltransferase/alpha-amylase
VFAHRCDWEDRTIVAVHNLARRAARAELALDPGDALQDLFGHRDARADDDGRLALDLEPHDHRWYAVARSAAEA